MGIPVISEVDPRDPRVADQLYSIQQQAYALEAQLIGCSNFPPLRESLEELSRSSDSFLAFTSEEQLLGALSFSTSGEYVAITRLVISPNRLRQGIASALMSELVQRVPPSATLLVSTAHANVPAVNLYMQFGFQVSSKSISLEGIPLIHLSKKRSK